MQEFNLTVGLKAEKKQTVTNLNTAKTYGSGDIDVFATPAMIGLMEGASLMITEKHLPQGFSSVGTKVDVYHTAATPIGMTVTAKAEIVEIHGKRLIFKIEAFDEKQQIGEGLHERYIIETEKFLKKAYAK